jgi:hypothetical protein
LAVALNALQTSTDPPVELLELAEPIAQTMGILHRIERSKGQDLAGRESIVVNIRKALDVLQNLTVSHEAVDAVMEQVAGCLSSAHQLSRLPAPSGAGAAAAPAQPAAAAAAAAPVAQLVANIPPPQPVATAPAFQPAAAPAAVPAVAPAVSKGPPGAGQTVRLDAGPAIQQAAQQAQLAAQQQAAQQAQLVAQQHAAQQAQLAAQQQAAQLAAQQQAAQLAAQQQAAQQAQLAAQQQAAQQAQLAAQQQAAQQAQLAAQQQAQLAAQQQAAQQAQLAAQQQAAQPAQATPVMSKAPAPAARPSQTGNVVVGLGAHSVSNFYKGLGGNDVIEYGGLFVSTYQIPKIGTPVNLHVKLPGDLEFQASGVVQWIREASGEGVDPGFGARFTQITPEGRQLVYRYTRNREPILYDDL